MRIKRPTRAELFQKIRNFVHVTVLVIAGLVFGILFQLVAFLTSQNKPKPHPAPFPVSVDPKDHAIDDNRLVEKYYKTNVAEIPDTGEEEGIFQALSANLQHLATSKWQNFMAAPLSRRLVIGSGDRKEEVADHFAAILDWNADEKQQFLTLVSSTSPELPEGKFFPGWYFVDEGASPETVAKLVNEKFDEEILARYPERVEDIISLHDALVIASLLEREARDFEDMRNVSGVIWNRLFMGMNLQLDATLQYSQNGSSGKWWPVPKPKDKYIDSPFNTYKHEGLPPEPISNPAVEAVLAALNPVRTDCLFYFHDSDGTFQCSKDYEGHVQKLRAAYGQGR